jgi:protoporphyrin/coproporphyrin ferrochelatase
MRFAVEPPTPPDSPERTAILLVNLGTPDAPTAPALRRYLAEFLWDPRVVEIPRALWWLILRAVILPLRPAKSAAKYASIWLPEGSPLLHWSTRVALRLQGHLGERGHAVPVRLAMRYGRPSMAAALDALKAEGATRILVLPLYPQYAAATTASAIDAVCAWAERTRRLPELRFVNGYHDDPGYIAALAAGIRAHWQREGRDGVLVMSFHGLPARSLRLGDPYFDQCQQTARLLAAELGLGEREYVITFQSRFGRAKWLEPYTEPTVQRLARDGQSRVDIVCPGFAADCLETLEEIGQEVRVAFLGAGGTRFHAIACLNDSERWIAALGEIALRHLAGWPTASARAAEADAPTRR